MIKKKKPPCNLGTSTYSIFGLQIATPFYGGRKRESQEIHYLKLSF